MHLQITAHAKSHGYTTSHLEVHNNLYSVRLEPNQQGQIERLRIRKKIHDYREYLTPIKNDPTITTTFDLNYSPHHDDLMNFLQHIESLGSFWCGIEKIDWQSAEFEWLPENPEEKSLLDTISFSFSYTYPDNREEINQSRLFETVAHRRKQTWMVIPLAFFREGMNEYGSQRYLYAFYNFYGDCKRFDTNL